MANDVQTFTAREVVAALIKERGLTEGIWGLFVQVGLQVQNLQNPNNDLIPAAILPLQHIGLCRHERESNIALDAKKVMSKIVLAHSLTEINRRMNGAQEL